MPCGRHDFRVGLQLMIRMHFIVCQSAKSLRTALWPSTDRYGVLDTKSLLFAFFRFSVNVSYEASCDRRDWCVCSTILCTKLQSHNHVRSSQPSLLRRYSPSLIGFVPVRRCQQQDSKKCSAQIWLFFHGLCLFDFWKIAWELCINPLIWY